MQTSIAQVLALAICGNARLAGADPWRPDPKLFAHCELVRFADLERTADGWREHPFADRFERWCEKLEAEGVWAYRARAFAQQGPGISDRRSTAFAGGGRRWTIETVSAAGSDLWEGRWSLGNKDHPDGRIWRVLYGRTEKGAPTGPPPAADLAEVAGRLRGALHDIARFAFGHPHLEGFVPSFDRALAALDGVLDPPPYVAIGPAGFVSPRARCLLAACQFAWVFGGMGSWNDAAFDDPEAQRRYDEVSDRLFDLLNAALEAAAASTAPTGPAGPAPRGRPRRRSWWRPW